MLRGKLFGGERVSDAGNHRSEWYSGGRHHRFPHRSGTSGSLYALPTKQLPVGNHAFPTADELKVARIGNSRGVRLPAKTLERYAIGDRVIMEETADGILLRPRRELHPKLSWEDTARAMAASDEDWSEWDAMAGDGLAGLT